MANRVSGRHTYHVNFLCLILVQITFMLILVNQCLFVTTVNKKLILSLINKCFLWRVSTENQIFNPHFECAVLKSVPAMLSLIVEGQPPKWVNCTFDPISRVASACHRWSRSIWGNWVAATCNFDECTQREGAFPL